jgi:hypothetical protein
LTRVWPFRKRPAPEPAEPSKPYEVKQPEIEDADVPPELVDLVNAAWKKYSIAQSEWSSAEERHTQVAKELASLESQITDTRIRLGGLDGYRVQILDAHDGAKLELEVQYGQIQAALLDAYDLAKASKRA